MAGFAVNLRNGVVIASALDQPDPSYEVVEVAGLRFIAPTNDALSYRRMLEELPEAEQERTPNYCEHCGAPEGDLCRSPGPDCPCGCELTGA